MRIKCPVCRCGHGLNKLLICNSIFSSVINKYLNFVELDNYINRDEYNCPHCDKHLSSKRNLQKHITNNVCCKKNEYKCDECNKLFSTKQKLNYHKENNVCKQSEPTNLMSNNSVTSNTSNTTNIGNQNIQTNIGTLNINLNANTNQIQDMAEMLPFRDASYKIPTKKYLEYVNNPDQAIKQFVKDYHLNPNKPERQNILNTNRRDNRVQLFDFDEDFICRWQTKDKAKVLELLCDRGVNALFFAKTMLAAAGIKLDPKKETELNAKIKEYESSDKVKKKYIDMIGDLTYDYRDMVETNKKKYDGLICKN